MAKHKEEKTNVMRILDQKKIPYQAHSYEETQSPLGDRAYGLHIAEKLGQDAARVFKTLVARGSGKNGTQYYVYCIPVAETLDLKKAAKSVGEKSVELIAVRELPGLTGYLRGGCSPIGMKRAFPAVLDRSALAQETICISAGKIGTQVELSPNDLLALTGAKAESVVITSE